MPDATHILIMLNVEDLADAGITAKVAAPERHAGSAFAPWPLEDRSAAARALASVWSGTPVTILNAPPGSGKSHSVIAIVTHLVTRLGLRIHVGCPTRAQAVSLMNRVVEALPPGAAELKMNRKGEEEDLTSVALKARIDHSIFAGVGQVSISTLASCQRSFSAPECDLFIVDEAYQATFSDVAKAARNAPQLLLVGDPGQIGPVVPVDTSQWESLTQAPHRRSPEVFARWEGARSFSIDRTYRLGAATAKAIAPLYDFPFASCRPGRNVAGPAGVLPEISQLAVGAVSGLDDFRMLAALVDRAEAFLALTLVEGANSRPVCPTDVAVVVSRNSQSGVVTAMLGSRGLPVGDASTGTRGITVGTADKLQGGEWACVVSLDPCAGAEEPSTSVLSLGRLCVMASRHSVHLTWVHADGWKKLIDDAAGCIPPMDRSKATRVRQALADTPAA